MDKFLSNIASSCSLAEADIIKMQQQAKENNEFIIQTLVEKYPHKEKTILDLYSQTFKIQVAKISEMNIPKNIISLIDRKIAQAFKVIPIDRAANNIILATLNPHNLEAIDSFRFKTGFHPKVVLATKRDIEAALHKYYPMQNVEISQISAKAKVQRQESREVIKEKGGDPIVQLVNQVLLQCVLKGASDIHFEIYESFLRVRLRIDGVLVEIARPAVGYASQLASRIKIMAKIDIAEKRKPQDGNIKTTIDNKPIDFRVSCLPTIHGEKIVLRILDKSNLQVDMTKLGFEQVDFDGFKSSIHKPFGIVLVTGPTGSGKTTTLYSALQDLNRGTENITTAEDPVEYNLEGINQVHIDEKTDLTFASALKAFLRQDPDIIMVGEIRDQETGEIAIKAALTGHLVLSTLHTNNAADTITRMIDMGLEPFNLTSSLNCVVAQRLMRRLCSSCRLPSKDEAELATLGIDVRQVAQYPLFKANPDGCDACSGQGYKGRTAVHEVMVINDDLKKAILNRASSLDIKAIAMRSGMSSMRQNALRKMFRGETDIAEVHKNTAPDTHTAQNKAS